ncbi:SDR family oxidoreductase [Klebsiella pneumoniae]
MIFLVYAINYADRTNIGAVLPFIIDEFHINNFEAGAIASMFFLGYAVSQIPAGFFIAKRGTRGLVSLSIFGFSAFTWLMGTVSSVFGLKLVRLGLGLSEGPCPVGLASTINNWFPPKEKATATGVYIAATMFAPIIVPPLAVWIAVTWGWRWVFFSFAIPGIVAAIEQILAKYGRVDVLVNNAGITQPLKLMDIKRANYDAVLDVSLRGTLLMSQAVIPTMRAQKSGSIVCISSVSAQRGGGIFGGPHYSAAKAGVLGLARAMARELGPDNVRVNCITPGLIQTDITAGKLTDDMTANILAGIPMNRLGDAIDIARAALFLGSDLSSYSTGITLDVNGGMLIH